MGDDVVHTSRGRLELRQCGSVSTTAGSREARPASCIVSGATYGESAAVWIILAVGQSWELPGPAHPRLVFRTASALQSGGPWGCKAVVNIS